MLKVVVVVGKSESSLSFSEAFVTFLLLVVLVKLVLVRVVVVSVASVPLVKFQVVLQVVISSSTHPK